MENSNKFSGKKESFSEKLGDKIERTGEKLERAGAERLGKVVYDAGNKIEHMNDKKTTK